MEKDMRYYVYIFTRDATNFNCGFCQNVDKVRKAYKELPDTQYPSRPYMLVYLEEVKTKEAAHQRFDEIIHITHAAKEALISHSNPKWVDLVPGINIEL